MKTVKPILGLAVTRVIIAAITVLLAIGVLLLIAYRLGVPEVNWLVGAARIDDLAKFKEIGAKGINLDAQEHGMVGETPLIASASTQGTNVFFYLLTAGAKVDGRGRKGETALMAAARFGDANFQKLQALITAGADVNARDNRGATALRFAKWAGAGGHVATNTIRFLEQHGAKE